MTSPKPILTLAPNGAITPYDREHASVYLRMLDAQAAGADWRDVAAVVLGLGPGVDVDEGQARIIYDSHLERARWLVDGGYWGLLQL